MRTPTEFDIVLIEKKGEGDGLTKAECMNIFDMLKYATAEPFVVEHPNGTSVAMGFISDEAAEKLNYLYTSLQIHLQEILENMELESDTGYYNIMGLDIYMSRNIDD